MGNFHKKVMACKQRANVVLLMRPLMSEMPAPMHFHDDPFFPFSREIIQATRDILAGYIFDFAAYMAHGAAGARALERSIAFVGQEHLKILHGPFVGPSYVPMIYEEAFGADAATIANAEDLPAYTATPQHGAFVVGNSQPPAYRPEIGHVVTQTNGTLYIAGENILYADYGQNFAKQCRLAITEHNDA